MDLPRVFAVLMVLLIPYSVNADGILDWLEDSGVEMKKTFVGTAAETGLPASINYINADDGDDFYSIDIGLKTRTLDWYRGPWQGRVAPSIEHHKNTRSVAEIEKSSIGVSFEFERDLGACNSSDITAAFCRALVADLEFKANRDSINDKTTRSATFLAGLHGQDNSWPGAKSPREDGRDLVFTYFPSFGMEHFESLPIEQKVGSDSVLLAPEVDESFYVFRIVSQLTLFSGYFDRDLMLTIDHANRRLTGSSQFIDRNTRFTDISLNYYLDADERISIGYSYSDGQSPARNFIDEQTSAIGLQIKLGGN